VVGVVLDSLVGSLDADGVVVSCIVDSHSVHQCSSCDHQLFIMQCQSSVCHVLSSFRTALPLAGVGGRGRLVLLKRVVGHATSQPRYNNMFVAQSINAHVGASSCHRVFTVSGRCRVDS